MAHPGPVVIAYDGTAAADHALRAGAELLAGRRALVVTVWKQGLGFDLVALPTSEVGLPPAPIDISTALEVDRAVFESARRAAENGAQLARELGLDAEPLAVADDVDTPVAETVARVARERDAQAIVVGAHGHGARDAAFLGGTTRDVVRNAPCPVVVVRHDEA